MSVYIIKKCVCVYIYVCVWGVVLINILVLQFLTSQTKIPSYTFEKEG